MLIKSRFRGLFWVRMILGFIVFIAMLSFCVKSIFIDFDKTQIPILIGAIVALLFIIYLSLDIFKIFSLKVTEREIEKTLLITKRKERIPYEIITDFKQERIKPRNTRGQIANEYNVSVLKFGNGKSLIISPDNFENYKEIELAIKNNLN